MTLSTIILSVYGITILVVLLSFAYISKKENELKAVKRSLYLASFILFIFGSFIFLPENIQWIIIALESVAIILLAIYLLSSNDTEEAVAPIHSGQRIDERDVMFSRLEITKRPDKQELYYNDNPDKLVLDQKWHKSPGLMSSKSQKYQILSFAAADASFETISQLKEVVELEPSEKKENISSEELSTFIKEWGKKLGALEVGICESKDYHYYTNRGRGKKYGDKVEKRHKYSIALTVEMNKEFLDAGPASPTLMESAQQYHNSGSIAVQISTFLSKLGFESRAHIDGDYELICPLVARDAGLGEIGRMGLLMTPKLGPRVRIAVVTTNAELISDDRNFDPSVDKFCDICKKCSGLCPANAISKDDKINIDGNLRWQINQEKCFGYWCKTGTDCGRCMAVCPYSHPDTFLHSITRKLIMKSPRFRPIAVALDDFFYGEVPKPKKSPKWIK